MKFELKFSIIKSFVFIQINNLLNSVCWFFSNILKLEVILL